MEGYTEVYVWGGDHFGQLGLAGRQIGKTYSVPKICGFSVLIKEISCGEEHTGFIADNGYVYCMGNNSEGRLGIGDRSVRQSSSPCLVEFLSSHIAKKIACGWGHTVVITDEGKAFSWGVGEFGALGNGSTESQWQPVAVRLPSGVRGKDVSCGSRHTAILVDDSHAQTLLFMCGAGEAGQLGTGRRDKELVPVQVSTVEELRQVSCGVFHTAFLTLSGRVFTTGGNSFGQLGTGNKKSTCLPIRVHCLDGIYIEKVACGHHSAVISDKGDLYIWGSGIFGEYLQPHKLGNFSLPIVDVSVGGCFGAAIDINHCIWTWGANSNGELGHGDYKERTTPFPLNALRGKKVKHISCGGCYAVALGVDVIQQRPRRDLSPIPRVAVEKSSMFDDDRSFKRKDESPYVRKSQDRAINLRETRDNTVSKVSRGPSPVLRREQPRAISSEKRRQEEENSYTRKEPSIDRRQFEEEVSKSRSDFAMEKRLFDDEFITFDKREVEPRNYEDDYTSFGRLDPVPDRNRFRDENTDRLKTSAGPDEELLNIMKRPTDRKKMEGLIVPNSRRENTDRAKNTSSDKQKTESSYERKETLSRARHRSPLKSSSNRASPERAVGNSTDLFDLKDALNQATHREIEKNWEVQKVYSDLARYQKLYEEAKAKENSLREENQRITGEFERFKAQSAREIETVLQEETNLRKDVQKLSSENAQLNSIVKEFASREQKLNSDTVHINTLLKDYNTREQKLASDNLHLANLLKESTQREQQLNSELSLLNNQLKESSLRDQKLTSEISHLNSLLKDANSREQKLSSDLSHLNSLLKDSNSREQKLSSELSFLNNQLKESNIREHKYLEDKEKVKLELEKTLNQTSKDADLLIQDEKIRRKHIEEDLYIATGQVRRLEELLSKVKEQVICVETEKTAIQEQLESVENEKDLFKERILELETEIHIVRQDKESLERKNYEQSKESQSFLLESQRNTEKLKESLYEENSRLNKEISSLQFKVDNLMRDLQDKDHALHLHENVYDENSKLGKEISSLQYKYEELTRDLIDKDHTLDQFTNLVKEWEHKYEDLLHENRSLSSQIAELEAKNKELFEVMERTLAKSASEYKEKTMSLLSTPNRVTINRSTPIPSEHSPIRDVSPLGKRKDIFMSQMSEISPIRGSVNKYSINTDRSNQDERKQLAPEHIHRLSSLASKGLEGSAESPLSKVRVSSPGRRSPDRPSVFSHRNSRSPERPQHSPTPSKELPTFRRPVGPSGNLFESLAEIKSRLSSIHQDKRELESRMSEFEKRLEDPSERSLDVRDY